MANRKKIQIGDKFKKTFLSNEGLPLFLAFIILSILFVLFRMKSLELDYSVNTINSKIDKTMLESKELKAKRAKLLSSKNLRKMARKHSLKQPTQKQIIVVP